MDNIDYIIHAQTLRATISGRSERGGGRKKGLVTEQEFVCSDSMAEPIRLCSKYGM